MSIADKLKTVAQKTEDVYRTGLFKYAPKSTASGKMVLLENSAPEPFVSMKSYGREIKVLGGNLFDISKFVGYDFIDDYGYGCYAEGNTIVIQTSDETGMALADKVGSKLRDLAPFLVVGETYTINAQATSTNYIYLECGEFWYFGESKIMTEELLNSTVFYRSEEYGVKNTISEIVINQGYASIPFEPYKEPKTLTIPQLNEGEYVDFGKGIIVTNNGNMPLTDDQIYAFKRMRANSPTTTIVGQGQVDVTYIVDNRQ